MNTSGRGYYRGSRGHRGGRRVSSVGITPQEIDAVWRGGNALDHAFEDVTDLLNSAHINGNSAIPVAPLLVTIWRFAHQIYDRSKFTGKYPPREMLQLPVWKYPEVIPVDAVKPLQQGAEYPANDAVAAVLSAESSLWDLFDRVLGQHNRNQTVLIAVSAGAAEYVDSVIAGRLRVFGATSVQPDKFVVRIHPWDRSGVRGVCNAVRRENMKAKTDLIVSVGDTATAVRVIILSAIVLKSTGFIVKLVSMDTLIATTIHTATMFFAEVNVIRYSDGSRWLYGRGRAMVSDDKHQPVPAAIKTFLYDALSITSTADGPARNSTFLSARELTSPAFAATAGVLIDSIDGVGGESVDCTGWAARTRWEYFR